MPTLGEIIETQKMNSKRAELKHTAFILRRKSMHEIVPLSEHDGNY